MKSERCLKFLEEASNYAMIFVFFIKHLYFQFENIILAEGLLPSFVFFRVCSVFKDTGQLSRPVLDHFEFHHVQHLKYLITPADVRLIMCGERVQIEKTRV